MWFVQRTELLGTRQRKGTEAMDPSQSSAGAAERERRRSGSPPPASTIAALEYQAWLRGVNEHMGVFKHLNPDEVFGTAANEMRLRVAAHVLLLKKQLDTSYAEGLRNLHGDVQELAERAGFHFGFFTWAYLSRLAVALIFFSASAYICGVASMITGYRTPNIMILDLDGRPTGRFTLPDYGHDLTEWILTRLGYAEGYIAMHHIPDAITISLSLFTLAFVIAHPRRFLIIRRAFIIFGMLFIMRSFTVTLTSLPDASPVCQGQFGRVNYKRQPMFPRVFFRAFKFMLSPGSTITCGDMIFSGHTVCLTMCSMIFRKYCRGKYVNSKVFFRSVHIPESACLVVRRLVYLVNIIGALLIVSTKFHYSLDVSISLCLTPWTFGFYHDVIRFPGLLKNTPLCKLLRWMETEDILAIDEKAFKLYSEKK